METSNIRVALEWYCLFVFGSTFAIQLQVYIELIFFCFWNVTNLAGGGGVGSTVVWDMLCHSTEDRTSHLWRSGHHTENRSHADVLVILETVRTCKVWDIWMTGNAWRDILPWESAGKCPVKQRSSHHYPFLFDRFNNKNADTRSVWVWQLVLQSERCVRLLLLWDVPRTQEP